MEKMSRQHEVLGNHNNRLSSMINP